MHTHTQTGFTVSYCIERIELQGDCGAIHLEAERILRRFTASALPYRVARDNEHYMLLRAVH